jgi:HK97 family phage prohead protease
MPLERREQISTWEYRVNAPADLQLRDAGSGTTPHLVGHASVFDQWYDAYKGRTYISREIVRQGAFTQAIQEQQDVRALFNHDESYVLGRTKAGTLQLSQDSIGLVSDITPPTTQLIRDMVLEPIRRGDISQMSFAFRVRKNAEVVLTVNGDTEVYFDGGQRITTRYDGDMLIEERELLNLDLFDVAPVTFPAYEQTDIGLQDRAAREKELRNRVITRHN